MRLSKRCPWVPSRVVDGPLSAVQPVTVIKLVGRLRSRIVSEIMTDIHLVSKHGAELASPVSQLHLIASEIEARIEEQSVSSLLVDAHIPFPQVAVDDARLDRLAFRCTQVVEESGNDYAADLGGCALEFRPGSIGLQIQFANAKEELAVKRGPGRIPIYSVG